MQVWGSVDENDELAVKWAKMDRQGTHSQKSNSTVIT